MPKRNRFGRNVSLCGLVSRNHNRREIRMGPIMTKTKRVIHTRGNKAETPNWRFGLDTCVPRKEVPELCEGLKFIANERHGGSYYYPDYKNGKMAVAFEWYLPYRGWKFGYKVGIEFWIEKDDLKQIGVYVLYGEDHPKRGKSPRFSVLEQRKFQNKMIESVTLASNWRTQLPLQQFHTVRYLELQGLGVIKHHIEIPPLNVIILPSVLLGKENARVSAVIQTVSARFKGEAKASGGDFLRFCALVTLATGSHHQPYKSTLGRTPLKQFVNGKSPVPSHENIYPRGKYREATEEKIDLSMGGVKLASEQYASLELQTRLRFDDCLFAYYTAKDLLGKNYGTVAAVALIAALKPFRQKNKGEAASIADSLCGEFGLHLGDKRRVDIRDVIRDVYSKQRSGYVHEAILRHGEFGSATPLSAPTEKSVISERLAARNRLLTLDFLTRRALLQYLANLAQQKFSSGAYGIDSEKYKCEIGSMSQFVVGSKYLVGIRSMGRI